jgi:GAF domain-containing protein
MPQVVEPDYAELLRTIGLQMLAPRNRQSLYDATVQGARKILCADFASLQRVSSGRPIQLELLAHHGFEPRSAEFFGWAGPKSALTCELALRSRERVVIPDVQSSTLLAGSDELEFYLLTGIRAVQTTPLVARSGDVVGMLTTHWHAAFAPSNRALAFFDVLARQAADLLDATRLEKEITDQAAHTAFLLELGDALRSLRDPREVRETAARLLGAHLDATHVFFARPQETHGHRFAIEEEYVPGERARPRSRFADLGRNTSDALRQGHTVARAIGRCVLFDDGGRAPPEPGGGSLCAVPRLENGRLDCVLVVRRDVQKWAPDEVALVTETAERVRDAVERARIERALHANQARLARVSDQLRVLFDGTRSVRT